jgi:serine/threonine protein phosphatase PrpC
VQEADGGFLRRVVIGAHSEQGQRPYQQDRFVTIPDYMQGEHSVRRSLAAIFDGHKTEQAAEIATAQLPKILAQQPDMAETSDGEADEKLPPASSEGLKSRDTSDVVAKALRNAVQQVDDLILRKEKKEAEEAGGYGGSTAIVALRIAECLYTAHVGDSGAILDREGTAYRLTVDHKPNDPKEKKRIEGKGGTIDQAANRVVSRRSSSGKASLLAMSRWVSHAVIPHAKMTMLHPAQGRHN